MKGKDIVFYSKDYQNFNSDGYLYQLIKNRILVNTPHRHDFFEIVFILQGNTRQNVDGASIDMQQAQFMFLHPNNTHFFEKQSGDLHVFCLSVLSEKFSKFLSAFEFAPVYGKVYTCKNATVMKDMFILPASLLYRQRLIIQSILATLFSHAIRETPIESAAAPPHLQLAIEKIRRSENIGGGVEKLAELSGYSRMHLGRMIKKYYGKTPAALLHDIRMNLAAEYLQKTSFTIEAITSLVGFSSPSQFHAAFKNRYHCTPSAYRKAKLSELTFSL